ncbi:MAG: RNA-binding protein [Acidobacteria bacterium CG_4_9_14_3_um_filter_49_7]|nr:MAG: RNA-binding protein [Acidobacteria bacterium CG_4_9_14_3_um_filter_49_7]
MSQSLYVGNLPYNASEDELRNLFAEHGPVESVRIITDRVTGLSRGFGFVDMETDEAAEAAIAALNGADFKGRALRVNVSKPKEDNRNRARY